MSNHDPFKEILPDVALYQNNKSQYLTYFFNFFNNVLQHDHRYAQHVPLPWPAFPETHYESLLVILSMHPP